VAVAVQHSVPQIAQTLVGQAVAIIKTQLPQETLEVLLRLKDMPVALEQIPLLLGPQVVVVEQVKLEKTLRPQELVARVALVKLLVGSPQQHVAIYLSGKKFHPQFILLVVVAVVQQITEELQQVEAVEAVEVVQEPEMQRQPQLQSVSQELLILVAAVAVAVKEEARWLEQTMPAEKVVLALY
jgi:hypothetical protein